VAPYKRKDLARMTDYQSTRKVRAKSGSTTLESGKRRRFIALEFEIYLAEPMNIVLNYESRRQN
jgi:hypothetical protein